MIANPAERKELENYLIREIVIMAGGNPDPVSHLLSNP